MEDSSFTSLRKDEPEFSLREWAAKAKISRDNTISRRFSGSYIRSFREDAKSFRSNFTISSTASSPGYPFGEEIDPSTYSFTNAIKALQTRSLNSWECFSLDGFTLNSKWNEAEKYICNPLSGEVPMECLSAKSLSGRSFRNLTNRIAMSAPLVYSNHSQQTQTNPCSITQLVQKLPIPEKKVEATTRDVGTQSTPPNLSSNSPSPASTPPIIERALKRCELEAEDSPNSNSKINIETEVIERETTKEEKVKEEKESRKIAEKNTCKQGGCLPWMRKRQRDEHKTRRRRFIPHLKGASGVVWELKEIMKEG